MTYWFTNPLLKFLVPLGNTTTAKSLNATFNVPRIHVGVNSIPEQGGGILDAIAVKCQRKKAFIVTDQAVRQYAERVVKSFENAGFQYRIWDATQPEVPLKNIQECSRAMIEFEPDLIVAVGGGSVMDMSKAAWILYENPEIGDLRTLMPFQPIGLRKKAILLAVSTTSGTRLEATTATVITDEENHRKVPIVSPELLPDFVALDPTFAMGMPPALTAGTGLDALAHAVDTVTSNASTDFADAMALRSIELIFSYLPRAYRNGKDREARLKMHIAACMAGIAFGNGTCTLTHSLGHALGASFHLHHGVAVGVMIPYTQQYFARISDKYLHICKALEIRGRTKDQRLKNFISQTQALMKNLNVPGNLNDLGITKTQLKKNMPKLVKESIEDPDTFGSPRWLTADNCEKLFWYAFEGKDVDF